MGLIARPEGCPSTLGQLQQQRYRIYGHCRNPQCWREFGVDLAGLIECFGPDCFLIELAAKRIICRVCRGLDVQWHITAPTLPFAGQTHLASVAGTPVHRVADKEPPLDRYRRLAAGSVMTVSLGEVRSIDDPERPPREYVAPASGKQRIRFLVWSAEDGAYTWTTGLFWLLDPADVWTANDR